MFRIEIWIPYWTRQDRDLDSLLAERLKIHLASKGVPSGAIATIVDCTNILDAVHAMLQPGTGK